MKAGRLIAATVMTAGILAVGFLAPEAVTEVMDRRLKTETAEFETESIQVESMEEMPDILQLVSRGYYGFELGYGVVPVDQFDRADREKTGRACCKVAQSAQVVHRVGCGVGTVIKQG